MKLKLIKKQDEAKGTKSFFWEPEKPLTYLPGQFLYFTIPSLKYPDPRGATRHFTFSSSPTEGNLIRLTTRIRPESGYKKTLDELAIGSVVEGEGPNGTFILNDNDLGPHVFLAGGIGITPFRCMIKYVVDKKLPHQIYLIYSNSIPEEIAFKTEFDELSAANPNIKVAMTVSKPEESHEKWEGQVGRIDETLIRKSFEIWNLKFENSTLWVAGPPPMVDAMQEILGKIGVTSNSLRAEKFTGY